MSKSSYEIASEVTAAWLSALGSVSTVSGYGKDVLAIISDPQKVLEFFKTFERAAVGK